MRKPVSIASPENWKNLQVLWLDGSQKVLNVRPDPCCGIAASPIQKTEVLERHAAAGRKQKIAASKAMLFVDREPLATCNAQSERTQVPKNACIDPVHDGLA